jgi:hypothetical protein
MASPFVVASPVQDQLFQPSPTGQLISVGNSSDQSLAQTFTVGVAGTLTRFDAYIEDAGGGGNLVLWNIQPTVGGVPDQSVTVSLASGTFLSTAAPQNSFSFYTINLDSSPISVSPGEVLAIAFSTANSGTSISWQGEKPNPYAHGDAFVGVPGANSTAWSTSFLAGYDLGFRTYVEPVPEPSSAFLLFVGVCGVLGIRHRDVA